MIDELFGWLIIAFEVALAVWVYHDAKRRHLERGKTLMAMSPLGWAVLIMFTSFIGLILYLGHRDAYSR
jgi:hypothetical protein